MKRKTRLRRRIYIAAAFAVLTAAVVAVPLLLGTRDNLVVVQGVAVLAAGTDRVTLHQPITILSVPAVTLQSGTVSIARTHADPAQFATSKTKPSRLAIERAIIRIDLSPQNSPATENSPNSNSQNAMAPRGMTRALAPLLDALKHHNFKALSLRDCTVLLISNGTSAYRLDTVQLDIALTQGAGVKATGTFRYRGETIKLASHIGPALPSKQTLQGKLVRSKSDAPRFPIKATLAGAMLSAQIDGHFQFGPRPQILARNTTLTLDNLSSAARWLGLRWPKNSLTTKFTLRGDLNWTGQAIAFQSATFRLGDNNAKGTLSLNYSASRPLIEATLAARDLDLTGYFATDKPEVTPSLIEPATWLGQFDPLSQFGLSTGTSMITALRGVDADIRVSADHVSGLGVKLGRTAATISLRAGKLLADLAEIEISKGGSGNLQVSLDVNNATARIGVRGRLQDIKAAQVTAMAFGAPILSGRGEVIFDVRGDGNARFEFFKTMNGKIALKIPGASRLALDLNALVKKNHADIRQPGWGAATSGSTSLSQVTTSLEFIDGIAHTRNISAIAGKVAVSAAGEIEFPAKSLDLKISLTDHVPGTLPADAPASSRPALVLHATGHWGHPDILPTDHANARP